MITANHLQHLVIITATIRFIKENVKSKELGNVSKEQLLSLQRNVNAYRVGIKELDRTAKYVRNFYTIVFVCIYRYHFILVILFKSVKKPFIYRL